MCNGTHPRLDRCHGSQRGECLLSTLPSNGRLACSSAMGHGRFASQVEYFTRQLMHLHMEGPYDVPNQDDARL